MKLPAFLLGAQLRPAVLCAAGISAAAVTSCFLLYRWRRILDGQRTTTAEDAANQTDACDGTEEHKRAIFPSGCDPTPQEVSVLSWQQVVSIPPLSCGPLVRIEQLCHTLHRANRRFAHTFSQQCFDSAKLVELKLQHKTIGEGLESEHWWVLSNEFYHLFPELPPQHFATVTAVACIKRFGTSISKASIYLRTESVETSLQNVTLQTKVSKTLKVVSIDSDGCFRSHQSSNTRILETPFMMQFSVYSDEPLEVYLSDCDSGASHLLITRLETWSFKLIRRLVPVNATVNNSDLGSSAAFFLD